MKLFGWKAAGRGKPRPGRSLARLTRGYGGLALGHWPRNYEDQIRSGYMENAIAQRAVRLVAENVAAAPLSVNIADAGAGAGDDDTAEALSLIRSTSGGQSLLETVAVHLLLHGNAFIEILQTPEGTPCELFALRPERVKVEADADGWPMGFVYKVAGAATRISPERVIHIRNMHPLDDHYGLGCLGAVSGAMAIHNAAAKWNKALLDNAARPSGALVYETDEGVPLSAEQFDRLKDELEASFSGMDNAGRPMLLEGGLKWQALSMSPADMDFVGLKAAAAREIALGFGVPPMLLGLPGDATYANYREANRALWRQAILPMATKLLEAISEGLQPWFEGLCMSVDLDQVGALSEDRERLWSQVTAADFLADDEKREMLGLPAAENMPAENAVAAAADTDTEDQDDEEDSA